jgi:hypothetical protein
MTEGSVVTDCWGELFYITPGLELELGFDGPQGFPLLFHNELSVAMFLGTLPSFDLALLSQRFSPRAKHRHKDIQQAIIRGRLLVFPMDAQISLVNAVQNGGRSTQSAFTKSSLGATNTKKLSTYGSASNDLQCVNRTQEVIRSDIRNVLRQIVEQERIESRKIEKSYKNKSALGKTGAHIQHFSRGLHQATESFLTWLKDVNDVVSLTQRLLRMLIAAQEASLVETENRYELFQKLLNEAEKKELVEVLGFDPSLVTIEKITEVYSLAKLVYDDQATRLIIAHFVEYYVKAQHSLEWSEISGGATFEIILTAFLAVVTGGVGAIASLGAQAKKLSQLKKLGELLSELAELLKKVPKAKKRTLREQKALEDKKERKKEKRPPPVKQDKDEETEKTDDDTIQNESVDQNKLTSSQLTQEKVSKADQKLEPVNPNKAKHGHGHAEHGSQTTAIQQERRIVTGIKPSGELGNPTSKASKFLSPEAEVEALDSGRAKLEQEITDHNIPKIVNGEPNRHAVMVESNKREGFGERWVRAKDSNGKNLKNKDGSFIPHKDPVKLNKAKLIYEYVPSKNKWETVTYFPVE